MPVLPNANPVRRSRDDRLGRAPFAHAIATLIRAREGTGLVVIGVEGPWGTGKSSVLALAAEELTRDARNREVLVSAWRTSSQDQFLANLSYSMATALRRDWQSSSWRIAWARLKRQPLPILVALFVPVLTVAALIVFPDVRGWTRRIVESDPKKLAESAGLFGLPILGFLFSKLSQPVLEGLRTLSGRNGLESLGAMERFAFDFDVLAAAQPRGTRFLILVEDLDRCSPTQVTAVLSAIAQTAGHPKADRLAFLLAYDREVLIHSIEQDAVKHLLEGKDDVDADGIAEDYLSRVVQLELPLPEPAPGTAARRQRRLPRLSTIIRAALVSAGIVAFGLTHIGAPGVQRWSAWFLLLVLLFVVGEMIATVAFRVSGDDLQIPGWQDANRQVAPWLSPAPPRIQVRIVNRAVAALVLRLDAGLSAFEALSIAALATRWPASFSAPSLAASLDQGPLDVAKGFRNKEVTEAIDEMANAGLPVEQFRDLKKLHAVVSSFSR